MKVRNFMRPNPFVLYVDDSLQNAVDIFNKEKIDGLPILNKRDKIAGIITRSNAFKLLASQTDLQIKLKEVMVDSLITIHPDEPIKKLITWNISTLPVVEDDQLVGIINLSDTIKAYYYSVRSLQKELDTVINSVHNGIICINEYGIIKIFNPAAQRALGMTAARIIGRNINDILPDSALMGILKTGKPEYGQKAYYNGKNFVSNRTPIINNHAVIGAVEVIQDLSELETLSRELVYTKDLKERLNAIINSSFDGIFVTDVEGNILRTNDACIRIIGNPDVSRKGKNITELDEAIFDKKLLHKAISSKKAVTVSQQVRYGNDVLVTANPILNNNGQSTGAVFNVRDITELSYLKEKINSLNQLYNTQVHKREITDKYIFKSPKSIDLIDLVLQVAQVDSTVLILGESGVGKEIIAEILHSNSNRSNKPFVRINCGAIPENLLESELFGYESGAFTGAKKGGKMGLFEVAHHGVLFLDEIAEIPMMLQVKLLRALQESEITRIGGTQPRKIDVRIIAATNRDLKEMVNTERFREDLYYRLNVVPIYVPPLRERREEIPDLINYFLKKFNKKYDMNKQLDQEVLEQLIDYDWPGNVRELENFIERAVVTTKGSIISKIKLPGHEKMPKSNYPNDLSSTEFEDKTLKEMVEDYEKKLIIKALCKYGTTRKVAAALGLNQSTIVRKAARLGIPLNTDRNSENTT